jgi:hypothetical protein
VSRDGVVWWSVDHASYAGSAPGARVVRGIVADVPDTFLLWQRPAYQVEIKTPAGELSDPQQAVSAWLTMPRRCSASSMRGALAVRASVAV